MQRFLSFVHKKRFYNTATDMIPGKDLIVISLTVYIKCPITPSLLECFQPLLKLEMFFPRIKLASNLPCLINNLSQPSVSPRKNAFQDTALRIVKFYANAFSPNPVKQSISDLFYPLQGYHRVPLERGMCFGHKWCNTDIDLPERAIYTLFQGRNVIGKPCNGIDIIIRFRRKSHHKIKFYQIPSLPECLFYALEQVIVGNILINNFSQGRSCRLRR